MVRNMDELFAGTPSLVVVKMMLHKQASSQDRDELMILGVTCALLYGYMRRIV